MVINENVLYSMGAETKQYSPSDFIFSEGDFAHYYYQIVEGEVKLNNYNEDGKEFIQNILSEGQCCGESILFIDKPYPMNAEALTECNILRLSKNLFFQLLEESPELYLEISNFLSQRLYYKYVMMQNISSLNPITRLKGLMDYLKSFHNDKALIRFLFL
ncbi:Crp/Fnr family transcriptional regulator [Chryseobacterium sp. PTM-20240506]|uniref:Crp/Fnr family transcriptional regulator n=1 Tax=Chryseobacterium sp. PTM-20240506 TaxID=3400631 RepID=UPI003AAE9365